MNYKYGIQRRIKDGDVTLILILVNVAVYVVCLIMSLIFGDSDPAERFMPLSASWGSLVKRPWTLVTYMFTHFSILHLLFNMLWLYCFGTLSSQMLSRRGILTVYLASGVCGALLYLAASPLHWLVPGGSMLTGASAAVLGLMTLAAVLRPDMPLNFMFIGTLRLKWVAVICIALAFLGLGGGNSGGVVAHAGGVLTGLAVGLYHSRHFSNIRFRLKCLTLRKNIRKTNEILSETSVNDISDTGKLDKLLDKIRTSGYASLSRKEREELLRISKELKK